MSQQPIATGYCLGGRFRIQTLLGSGELGAVYAASDQHGERSCVVKVLAREVLARPAAWSTFQSTSRTVGALATDAIARASDFGIDANSGQPFYASEHIMFRNLVQLVREGGPLTVSAWSTGLSTFSRSLALAATHGIAHGDLKPHNLFLAPQQPLWARITDFGMADLRRACPPVEGPAAIGWCAPEQLNGAAQSPRGDVFALGLVSFYVLTARHALRAMWTAQPAAGAVLQELLSPRAPAAQHAVAMGAVLPAAFDAWFERTLHPEPEARFEDPAEAAATFAALAVRAGLASEPPRHSTPGAASTRSPPHINLTLPRESVDAYPIAATRKDASDHTPNRMHTVEAPPIGQQVVLAETISNFPAQEAQATPPPPPITPLSSRAPALPGAAAQGRRWLLVGLATALLLLGLLAWAASRWLSTRAADPDALPPPLPDLGEPLRPTSVPPANAATVRFRCVPEGCERIICDGQTLAPGVSEAHLTPGKHSCSAARQGFRTASIVLDVRAGQNEQVIFQLLRN